MLLKNIKYNIFLHLTFKLKHWKKNKQRKLEYKVILGKLIRLFFNVDSCIKVENLLAYLLAPVSLSLRCLDITIRKSCKSSVIDTCFFNLAACTSIIENLFRNSRFSTENTLKNQYETVYLFQ